VITTDSLRILFMFELLDKRDLRSTTKNHRYFKHSKGLGVTFVAMSLSSKVPYYIRIICVSYSKHSMLWPYPQFMILKCVVIIIMIGKRF